MSDDEGGGKKSGYRLEYASSARAKCKGPKPCNGTAIAKGELRFGSLVDFRGNTSFSWRHWGCVTTKILSNMKNSFDEADELDGFDDLEEKDQEKIRKAWQEGHVADEDIPESARKPDGEEGDEEDDAKPAKAKAAGKATKKDANDGPGLFKLEYATSGRAKCKGGCDEPIVKDYLRLGLEGEFRGNKAYSYQHFGCVPDGVIAKLKKSYAQPTEIEGYSDLQDADKEKVQRAWDEGAIPEDDKGPGEPAAGLAPKRAPAKKAKKSGEDEPPKKRARKAKADQDDEEEEEEEKPKVNRAAPKRAAATKAKAAAKQEDYDEEEDEEEEKPKSKRASANKTPAKKEKAPAKAPAKKRASKKEADDEESGEDFGAEIDAVSGDEDEEEEEENSKKPKRAAAPKASSSKPASKPSSKPASKAKKPAANTAKASSSRKRKQQDDDDDDNA
ncbi:poly polymerase and DNA-ligase Zn-finger region-domain-containing protein [Cytidiella melzeri]|nr:poly polymerase and DNA-ligase Zn-finger region-domain-containing protein [Cytidiella melzeri]